ncbi:MAG TPA: transcriptional repressor [Candidatus Acetothermia bacterium]|nr:transcriptional repressor [Candidatus Acetothermia bacterium]
MDVAEVVDALRAAGKRVTQERRLLLRVIAANPHLDANEIYIKARKDDPKLNLSTVYRTVKMFTELGLVETSDFGQGHEHYEIRLKNHYHCICLGCGKVIEIPALLPLAKVGKDYGFSVIGAKIELFGYCEDCQKKKAKESRTSDGR